MNVALFDAVLIFGHRTPILPLIQTLNTTKIPSELSLDLWNPPTAQRPCSPMTTFMLGIDVDNNSALNLACQYLICQFRQFRHRFDAINATQRLLIGQFS